MTTFWEYKEPAVCNKCGGKFAVKADAQYEAYIPVAYQDMPYYVPVSQAGDGKQPCPACGHPNLEWPWWDVTN